MTLAVAAWWTSQVSAAEWAAPKARDVVEPRTQNKRARSNTNKQVHMAELGAPQLMDCRDLPIGRGPSRPTPRDGATSSSQFHPLTQTTLR